MQHAEHEIRLAAPHPGDPLGSSRRATLEESARRGNAKAIAELDSAPPLPESLAYLWRWFLELRAVQRSGMNGLEPIDHADLRAWQENTGRSLSPWEVDAIIALDRLARKTADKTREKMVPPPKPQR